jgi:hypothetical protein
MICELKYERRSVEGYLHLDVYEQSVDNGRRVEWLKAAELAEADYAVFVPNLKERAGKVSLRLARD